MKPVRIAVVGLGHAGSRYATLLLAGKIREAELTAVCSSQPEKLARFPGRVARFTAWSELLNAGAAEAVIVAVPHREHGPVAMAALNAGWHVLVEKPLAARVSDAQQLLDARRGREPLVLAIMLNLRTSALYQEVGRRIREGRLGRVRRVHWSFTDWYRTEAYFKSSSWRGTWRGEGGGLLINQVVHHLDLLQWWFGKPSSVGARAGWGKYHDIEVEDEVIGWWRGADGLAISMVFSTGEAPGLNHLEIFGEHGSLVMDGNEITEHRLATPLPTHGASCTAPDEKPLCRSERIRVDETGSTHLALIENFVRAIRHGEPLIAPAEEGLASLEITNAMQWAALTEKDVALPLDTEAFERDFHRLTARKIWK